MEQLSFVLHLKLIWAGLRTAMCSKEKCIDVYLLAVLVSILESRTVCKQNIFSSSLCRYNLWLSL